MVTTLHGVGEQEGGGEGSGGAGQLHLRSVHCGSRSSSLPPALVIALAQAVFARPTSRPCDVCIGVRALPVPLTPPRVPLQRSWHKRGSRMEVEAVAPIPEPSVLKRPAEPAEKEDGSPVPKK